MKIKSLERFKHTAKIKDSIINKKSTFIVDERVQVEEDEHDYFREHVVRVFHSYDGRWKLLEFRDCTPDDDDPWIQFSLTCSDNIKDFHLGMLNNIVSDRFSPMCGPCVQLDNYIDGFTIKDIFTNLKDINTPEDVINILEKYK